MRRLAAVAVLVALAIGAVGLELIVPHATTGAVVAIAPGSSRWNIALELRAAGVIRDPVSLEIWALLHPEAPLIAGNYRFEGSPSALAVWSTLRRGAVLRTQELVVPEGFNRFDIARALARKGLADADAFLAATAEPTLVRDLDPDAPSLEGYLFPDTYQIPPHASAAAIAAMMVARFRQATAQRLKGEWPPRMGPRTSTEADDIHTWVTIASMVEKETAAAAERPVIAGVFFNRLARHVPLQCDPTVIYAALLAGDYDGAIRRSDLNRPSPFNTYKTAGLPPGPIANPGLAALRAAMEPAATPYLYFVSDDAGGHRFAVTLNQQRRNVQLYERARAEREKANNGRR